MFITSSFLSLKVDELETLGCQALVVAGQADGEHLFHYETNDVEDIMEETIKKFGKKIGRYSLQFD